ncbi:toll/interleukin-1 receptor domain-containing protein [Methanococcoides burtonii]|uniref:Protein with Toll-Interleukin receptor domain n=1 Tax=Methanococcoides burtonii (strain DSM 6242 / NBRC 107633 / OCM 468 / ACE-M) TaxID=259564 RepID=Q12YL2_METBU|nr:toll/interleukin-1 receptor domain-containing protein [Methanococcoides burtonii]ABE51464.1 Protein with Toll-Interleukin receptor domain [Methanococcoides burtonii DSM 6242]
MSFKIFVSYSTKDVEEIKPILQQIQTIKDTEFFFADETLNPGDHISQRIINYITNCDVFIFFYSKFAYDSTYVQHEIGVAKANDKLIIPILLDETKPDGMLQGINYLNFYNQNKKQQEFVRLYNYINQNVQRKNRNSALSTLALLGLEYFLLKSDDEQEEDVF